MAYHVGMEDRVAGWFREDWTPIERRIWEDVAAELQAAGCNADASQLRWAMLEFGRRTVREEMSHPEYVDTPVQPADATLDLRTALLRVGVQAEIALLAHTRSPGGASAVFEEIAREIQHCYTILDASIRHLHEGGGES